MNTKHPIDFVITWVDGSDPVWQEKKAKHIGTKESEGNTKVRYRDWDNLKYWFRGVEKFAPWVRYVHFVTDDQKPDWLNLDHPKLKWVKHTDFIPEEYLPTFNSNSIELNMHRIPELSDTFVYFNDDMFLIRDTLPTDFFVNGLPCDQPKLGVLYPTEQFDQMIFNNIKMLNKYFSPKTCIKQNPGKWIKKQPFSGIIRLALFGNKNNISNSVNSHIHSCMIKSTFLDLWEKERDMFHSTCLCKQRSKNDITSYCIRDWQILSGEFYPKRPIGKAFSSLEISKSMKVMNYIQGQKGKIICVNDTDGEVNFEKHKSMLLTAFESILPEKSCFEI